MAQPVWTRHDAAAAILVAYHLAIAPHRRAHSRRSHVQRPQYKSCSKFWAKAQRNVKTEYHRIVICSIRTRLNRSASVPDNHPPKDEISKVTVPIRRPRRAIGPRGRSPSDHEAIHLDVERIEGPAAKTGPMVRRSRAFNRRAKRASRFP